MEVAMLITQQSESVGQNKQHPDDWSIFRVLPVVELKMSGGHQTLKDLVKSNGTERNSPRENSHSYKDYINTHWKDKPPSQEARWSWGMFVRVLPAILTWCGKASWVCQAVDGNRGPGLGCPTELKQPWRALQKTCRQGHFSGTQHVLDGPKCCWSLKTGISGLENLVLTRLTFPSMCRGITPTSTKKTSPCGRNTEVLPWWTMFVQR